MGLKGFLALSGCECDELMLIEKKSALKKKKKCKIMLKSFLCVRLHLNAVSIWSSSAFRKTVGAIKKTEMYGCVSVCVCD